MSWVKDARKLMQDFVAPELRAITVRMDSANKLSAERRTALPNKVESVRREVSMQMEPAMAIRRIEELLARQQNAPGEQRPVGQ